jgi:hypothetical protein
MAHSSATHLNEEGDFVFEFGTRSVIRPERALTLAHRKADFVVEYGAQLVVIECTDYDNPSNARADHGERKGLPKRLQSGEYLLAEAAPKMHGTMAGLALAGALPPKPKGLRFVLLVECAGLGIPEMLATSDQFSRVCCAAGPPGKDWSDVPATFEIVDISLWNKRFPDMPVARKSSARA